MPAEKTKTTEKAKMAKTAVKAKMAKTTVKAKTVNITTTDERTDEEIITSKRFIPATEGAKRMCRLNCKYLN